MLFFKQYKAACLSTISSHCLAAVLAKMSAFNSHMRQNGSSSTFEVKLGRFVAMLLLCDNTIRLLVSQLASVGKRANMSELQAHHCMKPEY